MRTPPLPTNIRFFREYLPRTNALAYFVEAAMTKKSRFYEIENSTECDHSSFFYLFSETVTPSPGRKTFTIK